MKDQNPYPARPSDLEGRVVRREIHCKDGDPTNHDLDNLEIQPCFPPEVARAHAAELRQALANLLEWNSRAGRTDTREWAAAKKLMTQIRDLEDALREGEQ